MKQAVEKRKPNGIVDYIALALTTFGVGYIPGAPGTYGSAVGVAIYVLAEWVFADFFTYLLFGVFGLTNRSGLREALVHAIILTGFFLFCHLGIWACDRSIPILGNSDPSEAVVDEVMGQLITFLFIPFTLSWPFILAGFLLFRLFDIWKPYPIRLLETLPGGLGICADDILAGVYAGVCLAIIYGVSITL